MSGDPARSHGVLLVLADGTADLVAARCAARLADSAGTRVLAAVVLPDAPAGPAQLRADAAAVSARVRPTMEAVDVPLTAVPLLLPDGCAAWSAELVRRQLRLLVRRSGARGVVLPPQRLAGMTAEALARALPGGVVARPEPPVRLPLPPGALVPVHALG